MSENSKNKIQNFDSFIKNFPRIKMPIDKYEIQYIEAGSVKNPPLIFLHGTIGSPEIFWREILALQDILHIISIKTPPIHAIDPLVIILHQFLQELGINKATWVGTSYGGFISQWFAEKFPNKVSKLIICNSFSDNIVLRKKNYYKVKIANILPSPIFVNNFKKSISHDLITYPQQDFQSYMKWQINQIYKPDVVSRLHCIMEKRLNTPLGDTKIPILLILTENDPLIPKELQVELIQHYPLAKNYYFPRDAGHFPYLTYSDKYIQIIQEFL